MYQTKSMKYAKRSKQGLIAWSYDDSASKKYKNRRRPNAQRAIITNYEPDENLC